MKSKLRAIAKKDVPDVKERIKNSPTFHQHIIQAQATHPASSINAFQRRMPRRGLVFASMIGVLLLALLAWPTPTVTTLHLSINPSLTLTVSHRQEILDVDALNADAVTMLSQLDTLVGQSLDEGIAVLLVSAVDQGYIISGQSGVLYDVTGANNARVTQQLQKVEALLRNIIAERMPDLEMMRGMAGRPTSLELDVMAHYGLSVMHARLIGAILHQDESLVMDELIGLSIRELNALLGEHGYQGPRHPFDDKDFPNRPDIPKRPDTPGPPNRPDHND